MFSSLFSTAIEDIQYAIHENSLSKFQRSLVEYSEERNLQISQVKLGDIYVEEGTLLDCAILSDASDLVEYLIKEGCRYSLKLYAQLIMRGMYMALAKFYPAGGVCSVCYEEKNFYYLKNCSHSFCKECLNSWVDSNVSNYTFTFGCPDRDCSYDFHPQDALNVLSCESKKVIYQEKLFEITVNKLDGFLFCRSCEAPAFYDTECTDCVTCVNCEYSFCPVCKKDAHVGWSCSEWAEMEDLNDEDELSHYWVKKNSKICPQCKTSIQKNGGCSHMSCTTCSYQFCWICGRKYTPGKYVFNEDKCSCPKTENPDDKYFDSIPTLWNLSQFS